MIATFKIATATSPGVEGSAACVRPEPAEVTSPTFPPSASGPPVATEMTSAEAILAVSKLISEHEAWEAETRRCLAAFSPPRRPELALQRVPELHEWITGVAATHVLVREDYLGLARAFADLRSVVDDIALERRGFRRSHWPDLARPRSVLSGRSRNARVALMLLRQTLILRARHAPE